MDKTTEQEIPKLHPGEQKIVDTLSNATRKQEALVTHSKMFKEYLVQIVLAHSNMHLCDNMGDYAVSAVDIFAKMAKRIQEDMEACDE